MKATFKGIDSEPDVESVYMYGQNFKKGEAVEVASPLARQKLANHPHFDAEVTDEDRKIDEQVRAEYAAAAQAGFMQAQANAIRTQQRGQQVTAPEPAPAPPPPETNMRPLRSAGEYQQVVEGAAAGTDLTNVLRPAPEQQASTDGKETTDGSADASGTRDTNPAKNQGGRSQGNSKR